MLRSVTKVGGAPRNGIFGITYSYTSNIREVFMSANFQ